MDVNGRGGNSTVLSEEEMDLRRGPWTVDEDLTLINYIATHGEGRWNSLARCAGTFFFPNPIQLISQNQRIPILNFSDLILLFFFSSLIHLTHNRIFHFLLKRMRYTHISIL